MVHFLEQRIQGPWISFTSSTELKSSFPLRHCLQNRPWLCLVCEICVMRKFHQGQSFHLNIQFCTVFSQYVVQALVKSSLVWKYQLSYGLGYLGKGSKKKPANYPHFVDKRLTPPPLSTSAEVNNIHTKEFCYPHSVTPPLPLSTFIKINDIFSSSI